jgi:phosphate transport system substrate-binding protein
MFSAKRAQIAAVIIVAVAGLLAGCSGEGTGTGPRPGGSVSLQGAGATFPNPLYQKWLSEYGKQNPAVRIDYQSIGSGGGIKQLQAQTVDFGASDTPMTDEDLKASPGEILHIPTALGAVVLSYNLQGISQPLRFSPEVIADIFLGKIKRWDDPRIRTDNPGVNLPDADITVVHRSDGSGTSEVFTDYLSKVSSEWKETVGAGKSPKWPAGIGGKGNEGVSGQLKKTPHTIGYIELAYARQNKLPVALIRNRAGKFIEPTDDSVMAAAAEAAARMPEDLRVSITDAPGENAYPLSSYTYILVYKDQKDPVKGKALVDFLWWGIHDGSQYAKALDYVPLPEAVVKRAEAKLNAITSGGQPVRKG